MLEPFHDVDPELGLSKGVHAASFHNVFGSNLSSFVWSYFHLCRQWNQLKIFWLKLPRYCSRFKIDAEQRMPPRFKDLFYEGKFLISINYSWYSWLYNRLQFKISTRIGFKGFFTLWTVLWTASILFEQVTDHFVAFRECCNNLKDWIYRIWIRHYHFKYRNDNNCVVREEGIYSATNVYNK